MSVSHAHLIRAALEMLVGRNDRFRARREEALRAVAVWEEETSRLEAERTDWIGELAELTQARLDVMQLRTERDSASEANWQMQLDVVRANTTAACATADMDRYDTALAVLDASTEKIGGDFIEEYRWKTGAYHKILGFRPKIMALAGEFRKLRAERDEARAALREAQASGVEWDAEAVELTRERDEARAERDAATDRLDNALNMEAAHGMAAARAEAALAEARAETARLAAALDAANESLGAARGEAGAILAMTEATERGRMFHDRRGMERTLIFLAALSADSEWAWLLAGLDVVARADDPE